MSSAESFKPIIYTVFFTIGASFFVPGLWEGIVHSIQATAEEILGAFDKGAADRANGLPSQAGEIDHPDEAVKSAYEAGYGDDEAANDNETDD